VTPGYAKPRSELPWLPYRTNDKVFVINSHNFDTLDPDAAAYIAAVEAADVATLATKYRDAINNFVIGAKSDGFWSAIKAACFLAGPATLEGALVPLVGPTPTNFNFIDSNYNRLTGLVGNGSTRFLNTNRNNNADPQNSNHNAIYFSSVTLSTTQVFMGSTGGATNGANSILAFSNALNLRNRVSVASNIGNTLPAGFFGINRSNASEYTYRRNGTNFTISRTSQSPHNANIFVFAGAVNDAPSTARIAWYSVGESLDLAALESRLATYMTEIA